MPAKTETDQIPTNITMTPEDNNIILLDTAEQQLRLERVRNLMTEKSISAILISDYANIYYLTGRVFAGYIYIAGPDTMPLYFVRRPVNLTGDGTVHITKPEQIAETIGPNLPDSIGLELDLLSYSMTKRLQKAIPAEIANCSGIMRQARSVKTQSEIERIKHAGTLHTAVYRHIPGLYEKGMSDIELQVEIERQLRLKGCLGLFRISGSSMETHMGTLIAGTNADTPSPYDFSMGGAGIDPSLPMGANGSIIKPGDTVMVDLNGSFGGYMTDMSRVFSCGVINEEAYRAHQCSIEICRAIEKMAVPGVPAKELYNTALEIARNAGLGHYFMGHRQQAGFIGHGVGIEINELPVIAPKSRDILAEGNVIALEPKFVIPGSGATGIENTYEVTSQGLRKLTMAPEEISPLGE